MISKAEVCTHVGWKGGREGGRKGGREGGRGDETELRGHYATPATRSRSNVTGAKSTKTTKQSGSNRQRQPQRAFTSVIMAHIPKTMFDTGRSVDG
jgi:hypothetical protein